MSSKFQLLSAAFAGMLLTAGAADAQIVTVTPNYGAGPPATAKPSGTYSVPASEVNLKWQVVCDYGTITNGVFTLWSGPAEVATPLNPGAGGGPFSWTQANPVNITNPPTGVYVRARLQSWVAAQNRWYTEATAYYPLPIGGGPE